MKKHNSLRICVGASAGGHMNQLLKLLEVSNNWPTQPSFYITTMKALAKKLSLYGPTYIIGECNRQHPLKILLVFIRSLILVIRKRPNVVITTGSLPIAFVCFSAKLLGAKIIWIDSIANVDQLSMSGSMVRRFADLFLIQWPDLVKKYNNVEYAGQIV